MSEGYTWWWGHGEDAEVWYPAGATREEALVTAREQWSEYGSDDAVAIWIGEARRAPVFEDIFTAADVLEEFETRNEDVADEDGKLLDMAVTEQQAAELEKLLNAAFAEWRRRHAIGRAWQLAFKHSEQAWPPPYARKNCSVCGAAVGDYFMCDEAAPDTFYCAWCFAETPCGKGAHGEGCETHSFICADIPA